MLRARPVVVLLLCLGLAGTSLAAKGGASAPKDPAAAIVAAALAQVGDAYAFGDEGPDRWDCSGLVFTLWQQVGGLSSVPRVSRQQAAWAVPIPLEQVLPGDLVTFGAPVNHIGIVVSRTGTAIRMVDAASSRRGVVVRDAWADPARRYGRVPRPTMPAVKPWTPPPVPTAATPVSAPASAPASAPTPGLPALTQTVRSSPVAIAAAKLARTAVGAPDPGDAALLAALWTMAGGRTFPATRDTLVAAGRPVPLAEARVGDLVVYPSPGAHVGLYVGSGLMVDASRSKGKVLLRAVWPARGLHLVRLPG